MLELLAFVSAPIMILFCKKIFSGFSKKKALAAILVAAIGLVSQDLSKTTANPYGRVLSVTVGFLGSGAALFFFAPSLFYGLKFIASAGVLSNFSAIVANDWHMPTSREAIKRWVENKKKIPKIILRVKFPLLRIYEPILTAKPDQQHTYPSATTSIRLKPLTNELSHPILGTGLFSIGDALIWLGFVVTAIQLPFIRRKKSP